MKFDYSCEAGKIELGGEARYFFENISSWAEVEFDYSCFVSSLMGGVSFSLESC